MIRVRVAARRARGAAVAAIASGRFAMKTATRKAALTVPASSTVRPRTSDSGMPSRTIPSTSARPACARRAGALAGGRGPSLAQAVDPTCGAEEDERPGEQPERDPAVAGRGLERLLHELVGDRAQKDAGPERHDQADLAARDRRPERDDPPITSEEPATSPQKKASPIKQPLFARW